MNRLAKIVLILVGLILPQMMFSCSPHEEAKRTRSAKGINVLLVTFDTTRADHIGTYGCKYAFTPTVDALAKQSVKFNRAFSSVPLTLPSHTTMMTGLYPFYHGVRDNTHFVVNPGLNTLAEVLQQNGYQTAAVVAAFVLDSRFGLDQGFDTYDDKVRPPSKFTPFTVPERNAAAVTDVAMNWLDSASEDRPYFLWVHYYDPHSAYHAPDSFTKYQGHPYDVEIAYADTEFGRLLDHVETLNAGGRPTLIVFAGDHGEALGQYGEPTHAYFAYDSTLHVPMLIRMPDGSHAGTEIDCPVGLVDIMPTVLDILGLPVPGVDQIHGRSLVDLIESGQPSEALARRPIALECYEPYYSYGWAPVQGVRVGEAKLIDAPTPELYLLSENPKETPGANRYTDQPELVAELRTAYRDLFDGMLAFPAFTQSPQTPEQDVVENLRALGYVASAVPDEEADPAQGKDLKEMLPFYQQVLRAITMITNGESAKAARLLVGLFEEEAGNRRVLWMLAELAATTPSVADDVLPAIETALKDGRVPAAMVPQVLVNCGRVYLAKDNDERALHYFSDATKVKEDYAAAHWWVGLTHLRIGRHEEAIKALDRSARLFGPDVDRVHFALGLALLAGGQTEKATEKWGGLLKRRQVPEGIWRAAADCPLDTVIAGKVIPDLQRLVTDESAPARVRAMAGIVCSDAFSLVQKTEQALSILQRMRSLLPEKDATLQLRLAGLHQQLGQTAQARTYVDRAYELAPARSDVVGAKAVVLEQQGKIDEAVQMLDAYHEAHPDDIGTINNLAWMLARQGQDLDRALKLAKRAIFRQSANPTVSDTLGWIYHLRGDKEMAVRYLSRSARIDPKNGTYQYHLGMAYRAAGELDRASQAFAKAVELAPTPRPGWYDEARSAVQSQ